MKLAYKGGNSGRPAPGGRGHTAAFTMVELAIAIAVVAFALVAIVGVLPTGVRVQKDNREETVVNQDGTYWLETLSTGAKGLDELTNYVDQIVVRNALERTLYVYGLGKPGNGTNYFRNGAEIVGLLGTPKYTCHVSGRWVTNTVTALVRSLSGTAESKPDPGKNQVVRIRERGSNRDVEVNARDTAFRYRLTSEMVPFNPVPRGGETNWNETGLTALERTWRYDYWLRGMHVRSNAYDLRLTLQWPVYETGSGTEVGRSQKTFRTLVSGYLLPVGLAQRGVAYYVQPSAFYLPR